MRTLALAPFAHNVEGMILTGESDFNYIFFLNELCLHAFYTGRGR